MKYSKQDLLTLLISLFILSSCNSPDEIGLEVSPQNKIDLQLIDTVTVRTTTVKEDTVITSGISQQPLGLLRDAVIGDTESRLAMSLSLPSTNLTFGTSPVLDSAVLVLKYGDEFYGDSVNSHYTVEVRQLAEKYNTSNFYSDVKTWQFNPTVIGSRSVNRFPIRDSVFITQVIKAKTDLKKYTAPHIRIPVNSSFINTNFLNAASSNFTSNTAFNSFIKGLYLTVKTQAAEKGGIVFFNLAQADSSRLEIYYRNVGTTIDTNVVKFNVNNTITSANITHTYTAAVQTQLNNPAQQFSTVYVQPLGGLRAKISFPYLNKLKDLANITINKAELIVQIEGGSDVLLDAAPRLTLYQTDIAAQRQEIPDRNIGQKDSYGDSRAIDANGPGGYYDKTKKQYTFIVTSYIQDIISGKNVQYNTYIAPLKNTVISNRGDASDIMPSATTAARSILGGGNNPTYKMKLNIIYTKLK